MEKPTAATLKYSDGMRVETVEIHNFLGITKTLMTVSNDLKDSVIWYAEMDASKGWKVNVWQDRTRESSRCHTLWEALFECLDYGWLDICEAHVARQAVRRAEEAGLKWVGTYVPMGQ